MKQMKIKLKSLVLIAFITFSNFGYAQVNYEMQVSNEIAINLMGTSTLHDWEMEANLASGEAQFIFKSGSGSELASLKSLWFALKVKDLKSDNEGLNKNAYKALNSDKYQNIRYTLISNTLTRKKEGYLFQSYGKLTIAGVTRDIKMDVHSIINPDGTVTCKGSYKLNMTDYNVEPPSFMFGAMTTGDALTLNFEVIYKKS
jgi:polyisoprenoid-binding protein YceI